MPRSENPSAASRQISRNAPTIGRRPGTLVILGSGIKAIGQFTIEAEAYLKWADAVYFCVADPATEKWISSRKPEAVDLYTLYDNGKHRAHTYVQMAELMLRPLRQGLNVVGIFYGHPGVFVYPSHRAIAIARQEGHDAFMLPAISALDCLFADLGIDPSTPGCQIFEATDLILRRRTLLTDAHVIIFQVGSVGDMGFSFSGFPNTHLPVLVRYLQDVYGDDYEVVHYIASQFSICDPVIERIPLSRFQDPAVHKKVTGISTFYIPPKIVRQADPESASKLGLLTRRVLRREKTDGRPLRALPAYGRRELEVIAQLDTHKPPPDYKPSRPSEGLYRLLEDLALNPAMLELFSENPERALQYRPGLSEVDRTAVLSRHYGRLRLAMQRSSREIAQQFVKRVLQDPALARRYQALQSADGRSLSGQASIQSALHQLGYDTTPEDVTQAFEEILSGDMLAWSGEYELVINGRRSGVLRVHSSGVSIDNVSIKGYKFDGHTLTWAATDGNTTSGFLEFVVLTSKEGEPLPNGSYVGPQVRGVIWPKGSEHPPGENAFGKVGIFSSERASDELAADPVEVWAGTYQTQVVSLSGSWEIGPSLVLRGSGVVPELDVDGTRVERCAYSNGNLSWTQVSPAYSGSLVFYQEQADGEGARSRFVGRLWRGFEHVPRVNAIGERADG